ncbi:heterokaryon incompatibility protein-domain-containing protein [Fusarium flagelliforme]|uniref:Vegetative incompatibility protein het-e-1 n=1 Tax=Fusarium flagelliforme TaxID=2675880 RepID=A0A395N2R5_9HYPO|nr:heterokaryon incompatibility protein-domain-containing protein [Fusarium flagelliforme]KAH7196423.1 heterokaryon incompatibility protein-domain-containing protein [Fusarium flagelliforme]RFN53869.1 vegetative incompatibility protein het-e-1 [Fusarium flagelliforme]
MGDNAESISLTHCPTCLLFRIRDTSQKAVLRPWGESRPSDPDPAESELLSYSRPFELDEATHPTLSYQAAAEFFHGDSSWHLGGDASICSLCDHWVNGLYTNEWGQKQEPIARITLGTFKDLEARAECCVCRFLCETISQSSFELDDMRTLALELRGCTAESHGFRATAVILYKDVEDFPHTTRIGTMECPQFTVLDKIDIKLDFATPEANWDRLRLWYSGLPSATDGPSNTADGNCSVNTPLPNGFCLINVPEARLVETDGVNVPKYAALSYVWGKSDEEIITTKENFESLKVSGRFREKDVPVLFQDAFQVCSQVGIDHFWIDRICVVQDDEKRKSAQLEAMGQIYSRSSFTIVSSEPEYINQGLPGVSQPREPPVRLCVGDKVLIPHSPGRPQDSTWRTRGWTYQEGLLSENVMLFGQSRVYMYSRGCEGAHVEAFGRYEIGKADYICASLVPEDQQYSDQVKEYSKRILTFGSDKINAFMGVLNSFGEHQFGLPNDIIDQAMLWHYRYEPALSGPKFPGHEFPSWSWASTVGPIEYRHLPTEHRPLFSVATWAIVQFDQSSNQPMVKMLDGLRPGKQSEAQQHLLTIRSHLSPFEAQSGYDPVAVVMAANLCERYRLIHGAFGDYIYGDASKSSTTAYENNLAGFSRWKIVFQYLKDLRGVLGSRDKVVLHLLMSSMPFKKAPWFKSLGQSIAQIPEKARVDTFLRLAKPSLPNLLGNLTTAELEAASQPGRIVVHAPKIAAQVKYTKAWPN